MKKSYFTRLLIYTSIFFFFTSAFEVFSQIPSDNNLPLITGNSENLSIRNIEDFTKYLYSKVEYPKKARKIGIEGTVIIQFKVDENGYVKDVKCLKGIGMGCDEEVLRAAINSPQWQLTDEIANEYTTAIKFKLK